MCTYDMHICMKWKSISYDWNQVRAFLATVEEGSFSKAALALGLTQSTLGRQVAGLEASLEVTLFERIGRKLSLTQTGLDLFDHVKDMGDAAAKISLTASGQAQSVEGRVTISATDLFSLYHMPCFIKGLQIVAPEVEIRVIVSNSLSDLQRREADIAIRHVQPQQSELIAKKVNEMTTHFYAAQSYIDKHGMPQDKNDLAKAEIVGFENAEELITILNENGFPFTVNSIKHSATSGIVCWEMVKHGLGIGLMSNTIGLQTPEVIKVLPDLEIMQVPVWLVTHRELKTNKRIRLVFDYLAESLSRI